MTLSQQDQKKLDYDRSTDLGYITCSIGQLTPIDQ